MTGGDGEVREAAVKTFADYMAKRNGRGVDADPGHRRVPRAFYAGWRRPPKDASLGTPEMQQEIRALSKASAGAGAEPRPDGFRNQLIDALREFGVMRQLATVITTDSRRDDPDPVDDLARRLDVDRGERGPHRVRRGVRAAQSLSAYANSRAMKVSWQLLQDSAFDLEAYTRSQFGISTGVLENTAYVVGDGSSKPTGITTQTTAGVTLPNSTAGVTGFSTSGASPARTR
jgi:HK97 family phage major capsid protein